MVDLAEFLTFLAYLGSPINDLRNAAEIQYEKIPIDFRIVYLVKVNCQTDGTMQQREMAAVLLRRIIVSKFSDAVNALGQELPNQIEQMIRSVEQESDDVVRRKKADCLAELARKSLEKDRYEWFGIFQFMLGCINSTEVGHREIALHLLYQFPGIVGNQKNHCQEVIRQMLGQCMQPQEQQKIRVSAAKATVAFLVDNVGDSSLLRHFHDLVPGILQTAVDTAAEDNDDVFKSLIELCEDAPDAIRDHIKEILTVSTEVARDAQRKDSIRQVALEIISIIVETIPEPTRKQTELIPDIKMQAKKEQEPTQSTSEASASMEEHSCLICMNAPRDAVFFPCGHVCSCIPCALPLKKCPMCRKKIEKAIKVYLS